MVGTGISPQYFLDEMSMDEVVAIIKRDNERQLRAWEMVRMIAFYCVAPHTRKIKQPEDLFRLHGEKKNKAVKKKDKKVIEKNFGRIAKHINKRWRRKSIL